MINFLDTAATAYYAGTPLISDKEFDYLADIFSYNKVGATISEYGEQITHYNRLYSLDKFYETDTLPLQDLSLVETPKLDGAAISITYVQGVLEKVSTRGNGLIGEDITSNFKGWEGIPQTVNRKGIMQVIGEMVSPKTIENARNYAAGALRLKDKEEFNSRDVDFVAYGYNCETKEDTYLGELVELAGLSFNVVNRVPEDYYPTDGVVFRVDDTAKYIELGFTSKAPKGAFALKDSGAFEVKNTTLKEVTWQVGKSGKCTPVAIFDEVVIEDAKVSRATLNNAGFVEDMNLSIGDTLIVTRAGGIIPKIIGVLCL